jgi:hypothetical protein
MSSSARRFHGLLLLTWLVLATGCSQFDMSRRIPWRSDTSDDPRQANKMLATWTDAVSHNPARPPQRGFGGRLMFFEAQSDKPVKVEGDLVVYAFDEEGRDPSNNKPDRKFVFPAETLESLYSESKIGHSYSVWIPWDETGGPRKEIGLIARLVPKQGPPVVSPQSKIILPGTKSPPRDQYTAPANQNRRTMANQEGVQAVAYNQTVGAARGSGPGGGYAGQYTAQSLGNSAPQTAPNAGSQLANRMKTTTINIQPNYGRRTPVAEIRSRRKRTREANPSADESTTSAQVESVPQTRSTRFSLSRSRPPAEPIARLSRDHGQTPPRPAGWRSLYQPRSEWGTSPSAE